jgi:hypothetical protein
MIQPQSLDVLFREYSDLQMFWAIRSGSGKYLVVPDRRFPGRRPVRFFKSRYDAVRVMETMLQVKPFLDVQKLEVVEVLLLEALRKIKADRIPPRADSFVVNSSDEVFAIINQLKQRSTT